MFLALDKSVLISICEEINKDISWSFLDHFDEAKFLAFHGESEGIIWMIKFYYDSETIGILESKNGDVDEELEFDYRSNNNICEILKIPFNENDSIEIVSESTNGNKKKPKEIEIPDTEIQITLDKNKKNKRDSYKIAPALLLVSLILISNDWTWTGWILLISTAFYFFDVSKKPLTPESVKSELINKEKERIEKIEKEKRELELERKRIEKQERVFKINQEKTGFRLSNTFLTEDKFDGTIIISTTRFNEFKSRNTSNQRGVNQSINLYDNYFTMPSVRISLYRGLWCSVLMIKKDQTKEFFLEFHFRSENLTTGANWDSEPSGENSTLDILFGKEKFSQGKIEILLNEKEENKRDITHSKLYLRQTFRFQIDEQTLKKIGNSKSEIRLSNFKYMSKDSNHWTFSDEMNVNLKNLVRDFVEDMRAS